MVDSKTIEYNVLAMSSAMLLQLLLLILLFLLPRPSPLSPTTSTAAAAAAAIGAQPGPHSVLLLLLLSRGEAVVIPVKKIALSSSERFELRINRVAKVGATRRHPANSLTEACASRKAATDISVEGEDDRAGDDDDDVGDDVAVGVIW